METAVNTQPYNLVQKPTVTTELAVEQCPEDGRLIRDEFCVLYDMVEARVQALMTDWSRDHQPETVAQFEKVVGVGSQWVVEHDEQRGALWNCDESTVAVHIHAATGEVADRIADAVVVRLREEADELVATYGAECDLSLEMRVELRFDFLELPELDEDARRRPMPGGGLLLSAEAELVHSYEPRCCPRREVS